MWEQISRQKGQAFRNGNRDELLPIRRFERQHHELLAVTMEDGYTTSMDLDDMYHTSTHQSDELQFLEEHLFGSSSPEFANHTDPDVFFMDILDFDKCHPSEFSDVFHDGIASESEYQKVGDDACFEEMYQLSENVDVQINQPLVISPPSGHVAQNSDTTNAAEDEEAESDDLRKSSRFNCKNLVSERNRRKRLKQQLLALRSMVPNITKMDKRSILVDALAYVQSIHEQMEMIQRELPMITNHTPDPWPEIQSENLLDPEPIPDVSTGSDAEVSTSSLEILNIEVEMIEERRFIVKISCIGSPGAAGRVFRVIESLSFEITYSTAEHIRPDETLITAFIKVKKQVTITEEKLRDCITSAALKSGFLLHDP